MTDEKPKGERIAKVMARSGVASRRDAERIILAGRVAVNGTKVDSPALDVFPSDKVTIDGKPIDAPQPARLWLYYKPVGLVTSEKDEKGRQTVFDTMPEGMPRVMSVGRLDITSEGLLLLTNDGELKRQLELPSTGWLRRYRVRVNGRPNDATFDPLRRGATIDGEEFLPMDITLDKQQGANAWLTVGLREGKNREIRRAMTEVGLIVNRLIRVSYGPFRLNQMKPGDVVEVKAKVMREQLGGLLGSDEDEGPARKPRHARSSDGPKSKGRSSRDGSERKSHGERGKRDDKPARSDRDAKPRREDRPHGKPERSFDRKERSGEGPPRGGARSERGAGKPGGKHGDKPARGDREAKPRREDRPYGKPERSFDRKERSGDGPARSGSRPDRAKGNEGRDRPGADGGARSGPRKGGGFGGKARSDGPGHERSSPHDRPKGKSGPGGSPRPNKGDRPRGSGPRKGGPTRKD